MSEDKFGVEINASTGGDVRMKVVKDLSVQTAPLIWVDGQINKIQLKSLITESVSHFELPIQNSRNEKVLVQEMKFSNTEDENNFREMCESVIPKALAECHPLLQRQGLMVRFVPEIWFKSGNREVEAAGAYVPFELDSYTSNLIVLSMNKLNSSVNKKSVSAVFTILHEIFERDYDLKNSKDGGLHKHSPLSSDYENAEHEDVSDRRALRIMKDVLGLVSER